jgi:hypothetical protein
MPQFQRKYLRQRLGRDHIGDCLVSRTTGSCGAGLHAYVIDSAQSDLSLSQSGGGAFQRASLRVNGMEWRVATFNCGSGAFITQMTTGTIVPSGAEYEVHEMVSATEKDRAIDDTVRRLSVRREHVLAAVDGAHHYSLADDVLRVLDAYCYASPESPTDRGKQTLAWWGVNTTGSGREIRIQPALHSGQQLVLDAVVRCTLGPNDTDTIDLPSEDWLLYGAEAQCWELLSKASPGQETTGYRTNAKRAAFKFTRLSAQYQPRLDLKIQFDGLV